MSDSDNEPIVIVCASDDAYSMPLAVMLYSTLVHFRDPRGIEVHVIDDGISATNRGKIEKIVGEFGGSLHWVSPPRSVVADLPAGHYYTVATYYRLLIPALLPDVDKAIYLDCDLIVQEDLTGLWEQEVGDHYFLAVQDEGYPFIDEVPHLTSCADVVIEEGAEYFNAGVLVMNLAQWRKESFPDDVIRFIEKWGDRMLCADQDALNALAQGRWGKLDGRWNQCIPTWENVNDVVPRPGGIVHYMGPHKPWSGEAIYPATALFEHYLRASGWYDEAGWLRYRASSMLGRTFATVRHVVRTAIKRPLSPTI